MTNKIRCLIVEDDNNHLVHLKRHIDNHNDLVFGDTCSKAQDILPILREGAEKEEPIELMFLDIALEDGDMAGMDFLENYHGYQLIPNTIITTTHAGKILAKTAVDLTSGILKGFIKKPVRFSEFSRIVAEIIEAQEPSSELDLRAHDQYFILKYKNKEQKAYVIEKIFWSELKYLTTKVNLDPDKNPPNSIKFITSSPQDDLILNSSLEGFAKFLPTQFKQIHQSYFINIDYIQFVFFNFEKVKLKGCEELIPIGRKYKDNLPKEYIHFKSS